MSPVPMQASRKLSNLPFQQTHLWGILVCGQEFTVACKVPLDHVPVLGYPVL